MEDLVFSDNDDYEASGREEEEDEGKNDGDEEVEGGEDESEEDDDEIMEGDEGRAPAVDKSWFDKGVEKSYLSHLSSVGLDADMTSPGMTALFRRMGATGRLDNFTSEQIAAMPLDQLALLVVRVKAKKKGASNLPKCDQLVLNTWANRTASPDTPVSQKAKGSRPRDGGTDPADAGPSNTAGRLVGSPSAATTTGKIRASDDVDEKAAKRPKPSKASEVSTPPSAKVIAATCATGATSSKVAGAKAVTPGAPSAKAVTPGAPSAKAVTPGAPSATPLGGASGTPSLLPKPAAPGAPVQPTSSVPSTLSQVIVSEVRAAQSVMERVITHEASDTKNHLTGLFEKLSTSLVSLLKENHEATTNALKTQKEDTQSLLTFTITENVSFVKTDMNAALDRISESIRNSITMQMAELNRLNRELGRLMTMCQDLEKAVRPVIEKPDQGGSSGLKP